MWKFSAVKRNETMQTSVSSGRKKKQNKQNTFLMPSKQAFKHSPHEVKFLFRLALLITIGDQGWEVNNKHVSGDNIAIFCSCDSLRA